MINDTHHRRLQCQHSLPQRRRRDELDRLSISQSIYLSGELVFFVLFAAAYVLQAQELFAGYPRWQLWLQIAFLTLAATLAAWRLGRTVLARSQVPSPHSMGLFRRTGLQPVLRVQRRWLWH